MSSYTVAPAQRAALLSGASIAVNLSPTCVYFRIFEEGGGGSIRWGVTLAQANHATEYHPVAANGNSGVIAANPDVIYIKAQGGNVNWYVQEVREGS